MKGIRYNLKILTSDKEYLHFNQISSNEACEIITRELKNLYKIENVKINGDTVYNLIKRPKFCDKNIQNYCSIEKSNIKEKTKKEVAKEKAEFNRLNRDKEKYERNQKYHLTFLKKKVTKIFDELEEAKQNELINVEIPIVETQIDDTITHNISPKTKSDNMDLYARSYSEDSSTRIFS